jgi:hypothetical protein
VVENCDLAYAGDDGIAVMVRPPEGRIVMVFAAEDRGQFRPGDQLRFYRFEDTSVDDAVIGRRPTGAHAWRGRKVSVPFIPHVATGPPWSPKVSWVALPAGAR